MPFTWFLWFTWQLICQYTLYTSSYRKTVRLRDDMNSHLRFSLMHQAAIDISAEDILSLLWPHCLGSSHFTVVWPVREFGSGGRSKITHPCASAFFFFDWPDCWLSWWSRGSVKGKVSSLPRTQLKNLCQTILCRGGTQSALSHNKASN